MILALRGTGNNAVKDIAEGWNRIVLHHAGCGIVGCWKHAPERLAAHLRVGTAELDPMAITAPHEAVRLDVAALKADPSLRPASWRAASSTTPPMP